jgi:hypothetical protein
MPLLGLVDGVRTVSCLLSADEWDEVKADVKAKRRTVTLPCGLPGHAKTSRLGTQYFAHNADCDGCSAQETAEHLLSRPGVSGDFIRWKDEVHVTSVVLFARDP